MKAVIKRRIKQFLEDAASNSQTNPVYSLLLCRMAAEAIIADTDENLSSKIKKMNLIGTPFQILLGKQSEGDLIEFKVTGQKAQKMKLEVIINTIKKEKLKN